MPSKKASARTTAPKQTEAAKRAVASRTTRRETVGEAALQTRSRRQFEKTSARAIQGHLQARGRRQQAKRDSR